MHNLKDIRDEMIEEIETYKGSIKDGDEKDAMCVKCLASAADHIDAILERHGMLEDDGEEEKRSGRRGGMSGRRSYEIDDTGLEYGNYAGDRVERGRADATSGNDKRAMRELKRIAQDVDNPQLRNAIMEASRMAEHM
jgi:hypothetical protein